VGVIAGVLAVLIAGAVIARRWLRDFLRWFIRTVFP
jgi:hypothetical protein